MLSLMIRGVAEGKADIPGVDKVAHRQLLRQRGLQPLGVQHEVVMQENASWCWAAPSAELPPAPRPGDSGPLGEKEEKSHTGLESVLGVGMTRFTVTSNDRGPRQLRLKDHSWMPRAEFKGCWMWWHQLLRFPSLSASRTWHMTALLRHLSLQWQHNNTAEEITP